MMVEWVKTPFVRISATTQTASISSSGVAPRALHRLCVTFDAVTILADMRDSDDLFHLRAQPTISERSPV